MVLAQGAARHYLHPEAGYGVKDLDVWTFHAPLSRRPLYPGRYETHAHFGPSTLGRNWYPAPIAGRERRWNDYTGRRLDFLVRELPVPVAADVATVVSVLQSWLARGATEPCRCHTPEGRNSSAHHLAHKAMVWIGTPPTRHLRGLATWDIDAGGAVN